jgi:hypothetical protein
MCGTVSQKREKHKVCYVVHAASLLERKAVLDDVGDVLLHVFMAGPSTLAMPLWVLFCNLALTLLLVTSANPNCFAGCRSSTFLPL